MRLTGNIHLAGGGVWGGMGLSPGPDCNIFAIDCAEAGVVLIDCGSGLDGSPEAILGNLRDDGIDPARIDTILLTHAHGDHAGGAAVLAARSGATVLADPLTADILAAGDEERSAVRAAREAGIFPAGFTLAPLPGITPIDDGTVIARGAVRITALATPGHCAGHLSFLVEAAGRRDLVAGDILFWRGRVLMQATQDCDPAQTAASILRLAELDGLDGLFPGHGAVTLSGAGRHIEAAAEAVRALRLPPAL